MTATIEAGPSSVRRERWLRLLPPILLVVLAIAFVGGQVAQQRPFSPIDEYVYFDYVAKVPTQGIVHSGEEVGEIARNELTCRGVVGYGGGFGEVCNVGTHDQDDLYPYGGGTGADIYSPLFFWLTWGAAQPLTWLGMGLLDAARAVGALWLTGTLLALYGGLREAGASRRVGFGLSALLFALPITEWSFPYISTDATTLAAGAALGYIAMRVWKGRMSGWWFVAASIAATALKLQNAAAVGAVSITFLVAGLIARRGAPRRALVVSALLAGVGAIAAQVVWMAIRSTSAVDERPDLGDGQSGFGPTVLADLATRTLFNMARVDITEGPVQEAGLFVLHLLIISAIVTALLADRRSEPLRFGGGVGVLSVGILLAPLLAATTLVLTHVFVQTPSRYSAALIPLLLLLVVPMLGRRTGTQTVVASVGALLAIAGLASALSF